MEKYSKAVSEMYSQFKEVEEVEEVEEVDLHWVKRYIGRHVTCQGRAREIVGYTTWIDGSCSPIVDASEDGGWNELDDGDVIVKKCDSYLYANIDNLID